MKEQEESRMTQDFGISNKTTKFAISEMKNCRKNTFSEANESEG